MTTETYLEITMPDDTVWWISLPDVARQIARMDVEEIGTITFQDALNNAMNDHRRCCEWVNGNLQWKGVYARLVSPSPSKYQSWLRRAAVRVVVRKGAEIGPQA